jgi:hypothetical protein
MKDDSHIQKLRLELEYLEWQIHQQIDTYNNLNEYKRIQKKLTKIYRENGYKF